MATLPLQDVIGVVLIIIVSSISLYLSVQLIKELKGDWKSRVNSEPNERVWLLLE
ncbi:hypothetical protein [Sulfuracidifex tepidarius]|uniref:Uncharacterized protein n=1 Tax=Sulfuracidifex tepidarius TaxID=1294262 RepID=A0A510DSV4_9CREN|nr:hypothetical protein [Sulfuracidifex tepidarius]BBG23296.1 hypothetical protein IC006_0580 [Sulfuracidifex tepidarius]BBG26049.1 hypothetical protein IC007_0554 [Sulfuracidifex tepidarius]